MSIYKLNDKQAVRLFRLLIRQQGCQISNEQLSTLPSCDSQTKLGVEVLAEAYVQQFQLDLYMLSGRNSID